MRRSSSSPRRPVGKLRRGGDAAAPAARQGPHSPPVGAQTSNVSGGNVRWFTTTLPQDAQRILLSLTPAQLRALDRHVYPLALYGHDGHDAMQAVNALHLAAGCA